jgi:hypothetical protein
MLGKSRGGEMVRRLTILSILGFSTAWVLLQIPNWLTPHTVALPQSVKSGEAEIAYLNTSTSASSWERVVAGLQRLHGLEVDVSHAFVERSTTVPEVVLRTPGRTGTLRIRWYKLTSDSDATSWIEALSLRNPAPVAIMGGGTTDRAVDLARALNRIDSWQGDRPNLLITMATANEILTESSGEESLPLVGSARSQPLMRLYPKRSFRFCFSNDQMAAAVADFVWSQPELRPGDFLGTPLGTVGGALSCDVWQEISGGSTRVFNLVWDDDPYSHDLSNHLLRAVPEVAMEGPKLHVTTRFMPFTVGTRHTPGREEQEASELIVESLAGRVGQRGLLLLPTVANPARRVIHALASSAPLLGKQLVAINGDGIPFNTVYRDADIAWPVRELAIPYVFFCHQNPVAWDLPTAPLIGNTINHEKTPRFSLPLDGSVKSGYQLDPPSGTEEILLYSELGRRIAMAAFQDDGTVVNDADNFADRLRTQEGPFFDEDGNRIGGSGEFVVWVKPVFLNDQRVANTATILVWSRQGASGWKRVGEIKGAE